MTTMTTKGYTYRCQSCKAGDFPIDGREFTSEQAAANHENAYHDGAQTCWPVEEIEAARALRNLHAELRHVESGHRVRLAPDGRCALVTSDSEPGVTRRVRAEGVNGLVRFACDCPAGSNLHVADGDVKCRHSAGLARRLEREGLARFDGTRWVLSTRIAPGPAPSADDVAEGLALLEDC
jgi:hypothetical protein